MISDLTPYEQLMQQLQQQQAGLTSMPMGDRLAQSQNTAPAAQTPAQGIPQAGQYTVPSFTSTLGSGQTFNPTDNTMAGINQGYQNNAANGIAVPPSNFARWSTYSPNVNINKTVPALGTTGLATGGVQLGYGSAPGTTQIGGGTGIGGGTQGGTQGGGQVPGVPNGTVSHSAPGSLVPAGYNSGFPAGGIGSPTAPITGTYNTANDLLGYLQNNYGQANQGNGNYTLQGFRFSDAMAKATPAAAQFNALMNKGDYNTAYSMLATGNQAGTQLLKSALQGDPQFMGQIINTFAKGGTNSYFGPQYSSDFYAPQVGGQFDAQGNWVNGDPALANLQAQYQSGALSRQDYSHALHAATSRAGAGILGALSGSKNG